MEPQEIIRNLNEAISLEVRSFLLYVRDVATPHLGPEDVETGKMLTRIADEESEFIDEIADLIEAAGGKVDLPGFRMGDVIYHYLTAEYLVGVCARRLEESLDAFRKIVARFEDHPEIHAVLSRIAERKARHLQELGTVTFS